VVQRLLAAVVFPLAIKRTVLAVLVVFPLLVIISDAVGVGGGDTSSVALGAGTASFVPKTNSSIALPSGLRFLVLILRLP